MNEKNDNFCEEDFVNCYINHNHTDLGQQCWDWIYNNFAKELYRDKDVTLDQHYDHMIKNSHNYYIFIGIGKGCKCGSCRDGAGLIVINENKEPDIYQVDFVKNSIYLSNPYKEGMQSFARSRHFNNSFK